MFREQIRPEDLVVHMRFPDAAAEESVVLQPHERNRAANMVIRTGEHDDIGDLAEVDQTFVVKIPARQVIRQRRVIEHEDLELRMPCRRTAQAMLHRVHRAVARPLGKDNLSLWRLQQPVEHAYHRREATAATGLHDRRGGTDVNKEVPARRRQLEPVAAVPDGNGRGGFDG